MQQELEGRRQDLIAKERSLDQAEAAAEKRWAKLTEDVSAKVLSLAPLSACQLYAAGLRHSVCTNCISLVVLPFRLEA